MNAHLYHYLFIYCSFESYEFYHTRLMAQTDNSRNRRRRLTKVESVPMKQISDATNLVVKLSTCCIERKLFSNSGKVVLSSTDKEVLTIVERALSDTRYASDQLFS
jgi:hypothetical protein